MLLLLAAIYISQLIPVYFDKFYIFCTDSESTANVESMVKKFKKNTHTYKTKGKQLQIPGKHTLSALPPAYGGSSGTA